MDPMLITAEDKHRAPDSSARWPELKRLLRLTWPHRRFIIAGFFASIVYGLLHSAGIVAVLPVLKVFLSEEGFHGWAARVVVEDRLEAELSLDAYLDPGSPGSGPSLFLAQVKPKSPLQSKQIGIGFRLCQVSGSDGPPGELLRKIVSAEKTVELSFLTPPAADGGQETRVVSLQLDDPSWKSRLLWAAASLIPLEESRSDRVRTLAYVLGLVVLLTLTSNIARFVAHYFTALGVLRGVMDLRRQLYSKVLRLPMDFFSQNISDIVSRFVQDAQEIQRGMLALFGKMLREPIRAGFLLVAALYLNARLTLLMLLIGPVVVLLFWYVGKRIREANKRLLRAYGHMIGALSTTLQAIGVVKAYTAEHAERRHLWKIEKGMFRNQIKVAMLEAGLPPILEVLGVFVISAVTLWLGAQVIDEQIKIEEFLTLVAALAMMSDPLRKMADVYPRVMRSTAGAQRIFWVIDSPAEAELLQGAVVLPPLSDGIEFRDIVFTYQGAPRPALNHVDVKIQKGETVAIVGPNGSGKTTLTKLLLRFHDPQEGQILFDGCELRDANLRSLRKQISWVSQDPVVFAMTIAENIAYGSRAANRNQIVEAAQRAHADDFITDKGADYEEIVGEAGKTLSGGQRQRLCIARAVLRNAPILIFDEATSQVDSESEQKIQASLSDLSKDRTTLIIAHRLSTIRFAKRILVMNEGRIIDNGTHDELFDRCRLYRTLCETQLASADR